MSLSGTTNTYLPPTLDGLNIIEADAIYINGIPINSDNLVPYTGASKNVNLGTFNFQTLGSITAKQHVFPSFGSTMMTGPTTSSIFYADAWEFNNTIQISSLGGGAFLSTSYLRLADGSNNSTLLTLQSDGIADFANTKVRVSTMASNVYDVVNLSTLQASVAFIENVNALNYVPYTGSLQNLNMGGSTIKTTGYVSTAYLTLSEATNGEAWTLYTLSTMGNLSTLGGLVIQETTSGNSVYLTGGVVGAKNFQFSSPGGGNAGKVVCTNGNSVMSTTISAGQLEYINALHSNAGGVGETNTWSNTQTFSVAPTLNSLTTATPSFSLGIDGSNQVIKFTPAVSGGTVNTSTLTARFLPYLSTGTTLTNSLLNQIDNDSIGLGYTSIPTYPLGSAGKNMYVNGSIFAGGLNSMVGTFGRDTNTSNPANEITFTAGGAGTLLTQVKSHSGSSAFVDATWTYSNTNPAPLGANQGQILLQADKLTMALTNGLIVNNSMSVASASVLTKLGGNSGANFFNIQGNDAGSSPYLGFYFNNLRRCYLGNASGTEVQIACENGAQLNLMTAGTSRIVVDTAGITTISSKELRVSNASSVAGGQIRLTNGTSGYGNILYNDGTAFFFLLTNNGDVNGNFNALRPLSIANATGRVSMSNGLTVSGDVSLSGNVFTGTGLGRIYWNNPSGGATHWGYPSGGGSDNYIRGTLTYIDTPIIFNNTMAIANLPQNTSVFSQVMTLNPTTSAVQKSQAMQRKLIDYYGGWGAGYNVVNAFYKFNSLVPVRLHGFYSGYWTGAYMGYAQIRIYSQVGGNYIFKVLPTFTNNGYNHITIPMDVVFDSSVLPNTGWHDVQITNYAGITTDANDQLMVNVSLLPIDSF